MVGFKPQKKEAEIPKTSGRDHMACIKDPTGTFQELQRCPRKQSALRQLPEQRVRRWLTADSPALRRKL